MLLAAPCAARAERSGVPAWLPPLPDTVAAFDVAYRAWMFEYGIKRATLAVSYRGRLVQVAGYGGGDGTERVHIASLSKAITAVCASRLVDAGKLDFDSELGQALADKLAALGPPTDQRLRTVTIGQLISHRGGIGGSGSGGDPATGANLLALFKRKSPSEAEANDMLGAVIKAPLGRRPGGSFGYSNGGYVLLGAAIEAVSGEEYRRHCARSVLEPLGIRNAGFARNWAVMGPYGGWSLSGPEYLAFYRSLEPGPNSILGPKARAWNEDGTGRAVPKIANVHYGLGLNLRRRGEAWQWSHTGSWDWTQASALGGRLETSFGSLATRSEFGASWFVHYIPQPSEQARRELDIVLWRAARTVKVWPEIDGFAKLGLR